MTGVNMSAVTPRSHAQILADKGGAVVSEAVARLIVIANEVAAGPVTVMNVLRKAYTDEGIAREFPRLNSTEEKDGTGDNAPFTEEYTAQEDVGGKSKSRKANFFTDYFRQTDEGKKWLFIKSQIAFAASKTERDKAEQAYLDMSFDALANLDTKANNALSKGRRYIRAAIGCWWVMQDLALEVATASSATDYCKAGDAMVSLVYSADFAKNNVPFDLIDNTRLRMSRPMAVGDVMKLDVRAAAKEKGNLFDNLLLQLKRGKKDDESSIPKLTSVDMFYDAFMAIMNFTDGQSAEGKAAQLAIKARMSQKKGGEILLKGFGDFVGEMNGMWDGALQTRYRRIIDKEIAEGGDDAPFTEVKAVA